MTKSRYFFIMLCIFSAHAFADSVAEVALNPYRELLIRGTYDHSDWSSFETIPKSRYDTFLTAFAALEEVQNPIVVELGTSRSFCHGGLIGCNMDDPIYWEPNTPSSWDWGAGFFTRMAAVSLRHLDPEIHTVDLIRSHIERCKLMTLDFSDIIKYYVSDSVEFLHQIPRGIHLLYLDTGDMTPIEPTAELQLSEAKVIVERDLIAKGGYILIDDVRNQTPKKFGDTSGLGKSKYALPYLLENGFELVMDEYQVLLRKR